MMLDQLTYFAETKVKLFNTMKEKKMHIGQQKHTSAIFLLFLDRLVSGTEFFHC